MLNQQRAFWAKRISVGLLLAITCEFANVVAIFLSDSLQRVYFPENRPVAAIIRLVHPG